METANRPPAAWARKFQPQLQLISFPPTDLTWEIAPNFWISNLDVEPIPDEIKNLCWVWKNVTFKGAPSPQIGIGRDALGLPTNKRPHLHQHMWELYNCKLLEPGRRLRRVEHCMRGCCNPEHWRPPMSASDMVALRDAPRAQRGPDPEPIPFPGPDPAPDPNSSSRVLENVPMTISEWDGFIDYLGGFDRRPTKAKVIELITDLGIDEGDAHRLFEILPSKEKYS